MSHPRFRVGRTRPTNIYVQLGDEPNDVDPQIGYINEGWAKVLVDQANGPAEQHLDVEILNAVARLFAKWDSPEHTDPTLVPEMSALRHAYVRAARPS